MQKTLGLSSLLCFSGYLVHIKIVPSLGEESDNMVTEFVDKANQQFWIIRTSFTDSLDFAWYLEQALFSKIIWSSCFII